MKEFGYGASSGLVFVTSNISKVFKTNLEDRQVHEARMASQVSARAIVSLQTETEA